MSGVPQVIVTLAPNGQLVAELPGFQATRRKVELRKGDAEATLRRILENQLLQETEIGLDGAPTQKQVDHWERHQIWPREGCRFCIAEGRMSKGISSRKRKEYISVADGTVKVRKMEAKVSGLPKKAKTKAKRPTVVLHAKTLKTADELGL